MQTVFEFKTLPANYNYLAPDSSEIRLLTEMDCGGLSHCLLPLGKTSIAVKHKTVNEIWYCISGEGEIWQSFNKVNKVMPFKVQDSFTIPVGNSFQFRNTGKVLLCILIVTMPKWPGADEAEVVNGNWGKEK